MSDIELVIKIPERIHYGIEKGITVNGSKASQILIDAVKNGTPLPKGHGDLIDRNDLLADSYSIDDWYGNEVNIVDVMTVKMADSIIEADKESEE